MGCSPRSLALGLILASALSPLVAQGGVFLDGRWEGSVDLGEGAEPLVLRLFPADPDAGAAAGGLVDLPTRRLFGYPMEWVERGADGLYFTFLGGAPFDGVFELIGTADPVGVGESFAVSGVARTRPAAATEAAADPATGGPFRLEYSGIDSRGEGFGARYLVDSGKGTLPGSLLLPDGEPGDAPPVVLLLSGAAADRDGNNHSVPGRSDALAQLAFALRARGVASLRFDRRGTGEAYRLAAREEDLRFDDHVGDARAAIAKLAADPRFSGVTVVGQGEGALVGAAALAGQPPGLVSGIAALCAPGHTELETVKDSLSRIPQALKPEADAIMAALESGGVYPDPSPFFADYFRPDAQPYLASLFRFRTRELFAAAPCPVLVVAGGSDLQVPAAETELLASARPDAAYRVVAGMSHALKSVGVDEEANYASFTDPSLPLAEGLADLVAAFAKSEALPDGGPR
jgi:fermentation-respiration switch protein FrsA (DUF1100 family)